MTVLIEILLALALLFVLSFLWGFLEETFPAPASAKEVKLQNPKKGIDFIGVTVVFFCHDGKGNFLVQKRSQTTRDEQGRWDCGGGSIEFGENIEESLRREIKEEYLADVVSHEFMGYRDIHRTLPNGRATHWVALDYKVLVNREQAGIGEPDSIEEIRWVTKDTIPEPQHSQFPLFLEKYKGTLFV